MKLGNEYSNIDLFQRTNNPIEVVKGIIQLGLQVSNNNDFKTFCSGLNNVDWDNVADKDMESHINRILKIIDGVAPEGTEFKQGAQTGGWGFWPIAQTSTPPIPNITVQSTTQPATPNDGLTD